MHYIDKLLRGCPVPRKPLGEAPEIKKGKQINRTLFRQIGAFPPIDVRCL